MPYVADGGKGHLRVIVYLYSATVEWWEGSVIVLPRWTRTGQEDHLGCVANKYESNLDAVRASMEE